MKTLTVERKEEIRESVISTLNSMGSRFFYRELTLSTKDEASYAASLWPRAVVFWERLTVGFRP